MYRCGASSCALGAYTDISALRITALGTKKNRSASNTRPACLLVRARIRLPSAFLVNLDEPTPLTFSTGLYATRSRVSTRSECVIVMKRSCIMCLMKKTRIEGQPKRASFSMRMSGIMLSNAPSTSRNAVKTSCPSRKALSVHIVSLERLSVQELPCLNPCCELGSQLFASTHQLSLFLIIVSNNLPKHDSRLLRGHTLLASPPELDIFFRTRCLVPSCECGSRFCRRWQVPNLLCRLHLSTATIASSGSRRIGLFLTQTRVQPGTDLCTKGVHIHHVTNDATKYHMVIAMLDPKSITEVSNIIREPPEESKYNTLKQTLLRRLTDPPDIQLH
ncbi:unnamed protein product [Trichogramma brassicae]|uniref:DUF7041 domain-containing protein n=1 Tax=Trichogramma brassicae TaxID=86971 RepID=A0A6H5IX40_9HYME|nr:unnamed protein product [Trichogramma brassicae]